MVLLTRPTGDCKCYSKNGLLSSCSPKSALIHAGGHEAPPPSHMMTNGPKSSAMRHRRLTVWKCVPVKEVSFEIWRGAKVVNGVSPSRTPLIVQTLSVTAHMRLSSYGQAPSRSADIGGSVQPPPVSTGSMHTVIFKLKPFPHHTTL